MKAYLPAAVVLDEYTDEALVAERTYKGDVAKTLLRVPDVYRQPVEVEVTRRSSRVTYRNSGSGIPMAESEFIADPHETRRAVVQEVLTQLAEERS